METTKGTITDLDSVIVVPSNLGWKPAQQAVLVSSLEPQDPIFFFF